jgi:hypothetical protein
MGQTSEEYKEKDAMQRAPAVSVLAAETLRAAAGTRAAEGAPVKGDERLSLFWRVFGGTLLSIAALVVVTLYQQLSGSINELRADVVRLNEGRGDLVKKDEFNSRLTPVWNGLSEAKGAGAGVAGVREKVLLQEQQLQQMQAEQKELLRELQLLRERVAKLEGREGSAKPAAAMAPAIAD